MAQLCNGDKSLTIKIDVYSQEPSGADKLYGSAKTNVNQILNEKKDFDLLNGKNERRGVFTFENFTIVEMPNFMEYLRSGWAINMSFAVDFTASNGELIEP